MTEAASRVGTRRRRGLSLAGLLAAAGALHAQPAAPPLTLGEVEAVHMALCMSPEQVDTLATKMGEDTFPGGGDSAKLLVKSMTAAVRSTGDRITAEAVAGDAGSRALVSRFLGECLLAGIPMDRQRRERAVGWLREDTAAGASDATDTLAVLVALGDLPGGDAELQRLLSARVPQVAPASGSSVQATALAPSAQQHMTLATMLLRGAISTFSTQLGASALPTAADAAKTRFVYRPCPGSFEPSAAPGVASPQRAPALARVRARLAQLPRTGLDCTDPALAAVAVPLTFALPPRIEPARR